MREGWGHDEEKMRVEGGGGRLEGKGWPVSFICGGWSQGGEEGRSDGE